MVVIRWIGRGRIKDISKYIHHWRVKKGNLISNKAVWLEWIVTDEFRLELHIFRQLVVIKSPNYELEEILNKVSQGTSTHS